MEGHCRYRIGTESLIREAADFTVSVRSNFGCIVRPLVFGVKLSDEDIAKIKCLRVAAMATTSWLSMG